MDNDDITAIYQVMGLYGHVIDGKQWHRLDELYTVDGVFDLSGLMGSELRYEGIDAIKGFLTSMPMPLAHIATNGYVFEEDDQVQSRGKWFMPTDEGTISGGVYRDVWAKTDQGWRLKERRVFGWAGAEET
jgi:SnoaL-like domain